MYGVSTANADQCWDESISVFSFLFVSGTLLDCGVGEEEKNP